jgi:hypothetical protein
MRLTSSFSLGFVLAASLASVGFSQQYAGAAPAPPPVYVPAGPNLQQQLAGLADQPATHNGYTFDRDTLQIAQGILEAQGMDAKRAALALKGISFDNYRYKQPAFYTPEAMAALIESYRAAGWKHLVNANQTPANTAQPKGTATDMWLHFSGADIDGVTVLTRGEKMMNVVQLSCDLRPLDLMHLGGHFGIPKVDPNAVMVPAPR